MAEDTSPEAERVLIELWRQASPARKIELISSANRTSRELALCGLELRYPAESSAQHHRRLADLWLGTELAERAYGRHIRHEPART
ncbi:MAG: hypothetical protein IPH09_12570 [bacterium]|nr:hypothetical protein [bacterium]